MALTSWITGEAISQKDAMWTYRLDYGGAISQTARRVNAMGATSEAVGERGCYCDDRMVLRRIAGAASILA